MSGEAVSFEYRAALRDAQAAAREYGNPVRVNLRGEADVERDAYGSIKSRTTSAALPVKAAQIDYTPTQRKLEKAGLEQECDCVVWLAVQDMADLGVDFNRFEVSRTTVTILATPEETGGTLYELREKGRASQFANGYLHWTLGLRRRG